MIELCLYLSGPMTGRPNFNYAEFSRHAKLLRSMGYVVKSPHEIDEGAQIESGAEPEKPYEYYLRKAIMLQLDCNSWVGMEGWTKSKGARREFSIARDLNHHLFLAMPVGDNIALKKFE